MTQKKTTFYPHLTTYDRVEVLAFADGTYGKHCVKEVTIPSYRKTLPQASQAYIDSWSDINPEIVDVHFEYMNPRVDIFTTER